MAAPLALDMKLGADALLTLNATRAKPAKGPTDKTRGQAQDFEAVFLNSMFQHMYTGVDGDGPFGDSSGVGPWRSFLTEEYSKSLAKKGGIGLADHVYSALMAQQETKAKQVAGAAPKE